MNKIFIPQIYFETFKSERDTISVWWSFLNPKFSVRIKLELMLGVDRENLILTFFLVIFCIMRIFLAPPLVETPAHLDMFLKTSLNQTYVFSVRQLCNAYF